MTGVEHESVAEGGQGLLPEAPGRREEASSVLHSVLNVATRLVDPPAQASVTLPRQGGWVTRAATAPPALRIDAIEYAHREGPCISAIEDGTVVAVADLATETRWRAVAARALDETGVRAVLSIPLVQGATVTGSVNLYAWQPNAFDSRSRGPAHALAAHTACVLTALEELDRLREMRDRAADAERSAAGLAYDLRSRLTALAAAADVVLRRRAQFDRRGQDALELLSGECAQLEHLIEDFLARPRRGTPAQET